MTGLSINESLRRLIHDSERVGSKLTELTISDDAARQLADELASMNMMPKTNVADIYAGMKAGTAKFMDRKISVTE